MSDDVIWKSKTVRYEIKKRLAKLHGDEEKRLAKLHGDEDSRNGASSNSLPRDTVGDLMK